MASLRFDDQVAIVTGAGNGLGRAYALELGKRGAKVVVNDLGGTVAGSGRASAPADDVVELIKSGGGTAIASYHSVLDGEKVVADAMQAFGRVDILINNAGILQDTSFLKMTEKQWDAVIGVHLQGTVAMTRAVWNQMRSQGYGRIVMVTSSTGLYGNFGQANYGAAKLAILGLANTLSREGVRRNIRVNTVAPTAASRMTESLLPPDMLGILKPELVTPMVLTLAHSSCPVTGGVYEAGAGWFSRLRWQRSAGATFDITKPVTPEDVLAAWPKIDDFTNAVIPDSTQSAFSPIIANIQRHAGLPPSESSIGEGLSAADVSSELKQAREATAQLASGSRLNVSAATAYQFPDLPYTYTARDVSLYALALGVARDPLNAADLAYVYELSGSPDFKALPTMAVLWPFANMTHLSEVPGLVFNPMLLLHGEQDLVIHRPLQTEGTITSKTRLSDIYDTGKAAVAEMVSDSYDADGRLVATNHSKIVLRGAGGFGGQRAPKATWTKPTTPPTAEDVTPTAPSQALLYRLSGDYNPLHADPGFAAAAGFSQPILHGLCTFGIAGRAIVKHLAGDDAAALRRLKARFVQPVVPGEALRTVMWAAPSTSKAGSRSPNELAVQFEVYNEATGKTVLTHGEATIAVTAKL